MHFLNDVTDSNNSESYDNITVANSYLADIIETCQVYYGGWKRPDRIHWLTNCIQRQIDGYDAGSFPTSEEPSSYTVTSGHSVDATETRRLWRMQFFNSSSLYAPLLAAIQGPMDVPPNEDCTWYAVPSGGKKPYSYSWSGFLSGSGISVTGGGGGTLNLTITDSQSPPQQAYADPFGVEVDEELEACMF